MLEADRKSRYIGADGEDPELILLDNLARSRRGDEAARSAVEYHDIVGFSGIRREFDKIVIRHEFLDADFIMLEPGEYQMGPTGAEQVPVKVRKPYLLGKYTVTQDQWIKVFGHNPSRFAGKHRPVEQVSWLDCQFFLEMLNRIEFLQRVEVRRDFVVIELPHDLHSMGVEISEELRDDESSEDSLIDYEVEWIDGIPRYIVDGEIHGLAVFSFNGDMEDAYDIWKKSGEGWRLPGEAEWEYACRAETVTRFPSAALSNPRAGGSDEEHLKKIAVFGRDSEKGHESCFEVDDKGRRIPTREPNDAGFVHMLGNVWEWCGDYYHDITAPGRPPDARAWNREWDTLRDVIVKRLKERIPDLEDSSITRELVLEELLLIEEESSSPLPLSLMKGAIAYPEESPLIAENSGSVGDNYTRPLEDSPTTSTLPSTSTTDSAGRVLGLPMLSDSESRDESENPTERIGEIASSIQPLTFASSPHQTLSGSEEEKDSSQMEESSRPSESESLELNTELPSFGLEVDDVDRPLGEAFSGPQSQMNPSSMTSLQPSADHGREDVNSESLRTLRSESLVSSSIEPGSSSLGSSPSTEELVPSDFDSQGNSITSPWARNMRPLSEGQSRASSQRLVTGPISHQEIEESPSYLSRDASSIEAVPSSQDVFTIRPHQYSRQASESREDEHSSDPTLTGGHLRTTTSTPPSPNTISTSPLLRSELQPDASDGETSLDEAGSTQALSMDSPKLEDEIDPQQTLGDGDSGSLGRNLLVAMVDDANFAGPRRSDPPQGFTFITSSPPDLETEESARPRSISSHSEVLDTPRQETLREIGPCVESSGALESGALESREDEDSSDPTSRSISPLMAIRPDSLLEDEETSNSLLILPLGGSISEFREESLLTATSLFQEEEANFQEGDIAGEESESPGAPNGNGRIYPPGVLRDAFQEDIDNDFARWAQAVLPHPTDQEGEERPDFIPCPSSLPSPCPEEELLSEPLSMSPTSSISELTSRSHHVHQEISDSESPEALDPARLGSFARALERASQEIFDRTQRSGNNEMRVHPHLMAMRRGNSYYWSDLDESCFVFMSEFKIIEVPNTGFRLAR